MRTLATAPNPSGLLRDLTSANRMPSRTAYETRWGTLSSAMEAAHAS
jgi:hypothetical protein